MIDQLKQNAYDARLVRESAEAACDVAFYKSENEWQSATAALRAAEQREREAVEALRIAEGSLIVDTTVCENETRATEIGRQFANFEVYPAARGAVSNCSIEVADDTVWVVKTYTYVHPLTKLESVRAGVVFDND